MDPVTLGLNSFLQAVLQTTKYRKIDSSGKERERSARLKCPPSPATRRLLAGGMSPAHTAPRWPATAASVFSEENARGSQFLVGNHGEGSINRAEQLHPGVRRTSLEPWALTRTILSTWGRIFPSFPGLRSLAPSPPLFSPHPALAFLLLAF